MGSTRLAPIRKNKQQAELGGEEWHSTAGSTCAWSIARHGACINRLRVKQTETEGNTHTHMHTPLTSHSKRLYLHSKNKLFLPIKETKFQKPKRATGSPSSPLSLK